VPETTETTTVDRPAEEVFAALADFSRLDEWDPMFDDAEQVTPGPITVGTTFATRGSVAGRDLELDLTVTELDPPHRIVLAGQGDGLRTQEILEVEDLGDMTQVTYRSSFETDKADAVDAAMQLPFWAVGKRAIRGLREWFDGDDA
jgi:dehydrogenase/reductase SDR family member 12